MANFLEKGVTVVEVDGSSYLLFKDVTIIRSGVFQYLGKDLQGDFEPNKIYNVLRNEEMLTSEEVISKFELKPIIDGHTSLGRYATPPEEKGIDGVSVNVRAQNGNLIADLKVFSVSMQEDIDDGKRGLSAGMDCVYEKTAGVYNGIKYDVKQKIVGVNHIALTYRERDRGNTTIKKPKYILTNDEDSTSIGDGTMSIFSEEQEKQLSALIEQAVNQAVRKILESKKETNDSEDDDEDKKLTKDDVSVDTPDEALNEAVQALEQIQNVAQEAKTDIEEVAETNDSVSSLSLKAMHEFDSLYKSTSTLFGKFDKHKFSTIKELSRYALKKLDIPIQRGAEVMQAKTALTVALRNKAPREQKSLTMDSAPCGFVDFVDAREHLINLSKRK